jgi:hypothetical protein
MAPAGWKAQPRGTKREEWKRLSVQKAARLGWDVRGDDEADALGQLHQLLRKLKISRNGRRRSTASTAARPMSLTSLARADPANRRAGGKPAIEITRCAPHEPPWEVAQTVRRAPSGGHTAAADDRRRLGHDHGRSCLEFPFVGRERQPDSDRSAERHYRTMTLDEIAALPVKAIAAKNAHLFMWTTGPFLGEGPGSREPGASNSARPASCG